MKRKNILKKSITGTQKEMQLVPEPIFTVTTDGIAITTIANTSSGRIFLGGRNGSLYEIYYQVNITLTAGLTKFS